MPPATLAIDSSQPSQNLPPNYVTSFKTMMKLYDEKHFKRSVKIADFILKKFPDHGETLSMKALGLSHLPSRKNDALDLAKKGLRNNLKSATCWHVLGLLYRNETEAMKYFRQAHRLSPENILLGRDLGSLQMQERSLSGFLETRRSLFYHHVGLRRHWISFAFAHHINGNYSLALHLLEIAFQQFVRPSPEDPSNNPLSGTQFWEDGEVEQYYALLLEEAGSYKAAIHYLDFIGPDVPDKIGRLETLGRLYIFTNSLDLAHNVYMELFSRCRANNRYLLCAFCTHPEFRKLIQLPLSPGDAILKNEKAALYEEHANLLRLSPYVLGSPQLTTNGTKGWPVHPKYYLYKELSKTNRANINKDDVVEGITFCLVRKLTEEEETVLSNWMLTQIFSVDQKNSNDTALRFILNFISNEERFLFYADKLLRPKILKGAPFCMNSMKHLCEIPHKAAMINKLLNNYISHLKMVAQEPINLKRTDNTTTEHDRLSSLPPLGPLPKPPSEVVEDSQQSCYKCLENEVQYPVTIQACLAVALGTLGFFLDCCGDTEGALNTLNMAIAHTPTLLELYQIKAKVLKHSGDLEAAAVSYSIAREMDLADRYLNTQCVKYWLAADNISRATKWALYFSRQGEADSLTEMQCMWYEIRLGDALLRQNKVESALTQYYHVVSHFKTMKLDQCDFHWYCQRRGSFRSYLQFLRMENRLEAFSYYRKAVSKIVPVLLQQYDSKLNTTILTPSNNVTLVPISSPSSNSSTTDPAVATESTKSRKKKQNKQTDIQTKSELDGKAYLAANGKPLDEAATLVNTLRKVAQLSPETYSLSYSVAFRQGKVLIMLQSLHRLFLLAENDLFHISFAPLFYHFLVAVMIPQQFISHVFLNNGNLKAVDTIDSADIKHSFLSDCVYNTLNSIFEHATETLFLAIQDSDGYDALPELFLDSVIQHTATDNSVVTLTTALLCLQIRPEAVTYFKEAINDSIQKLDRFNAKMKDCISLFDAAKKTEFYPSIQMLLKETFPRAIYFH